MDKHLPPVSIEQFAAYLDGNLPEAEMQQISKLATQDENLGRLLDASSQIEDTLLSYEKQGLELPDEIANMDFELPDINNLDIFTLVDDSFSGNASHYLQEVINAEENFQQ